MADDAGAIAAAAAALLADPQRRQALGAQARAFVQDQFSPAAHLRRLEAVYAELVAPARGLAQPQALARPQAPAQNALQNALQTPAQTEAGP